MARRAWRSLLGLPLLFAMLGALSVALAACSGECTSARDCSSGFVCQEAKCVSSLNQNLSNCSCNEMCNGRACGEAAPSGTEDLLVCVASRCRVKVERGLQASD